MDQRKSQEVSTGKSTTTTKNTQKESVRKANTTTFAQNKQKKTIRSKITNSSLIQHASATSSPKLRIRVTECKASVRHQSSTVYRQYKRQLRHSNLQHRARLRRIATYPNNDIIKPQHIFGPKLHEHSRTSAHDIGN